MSSRIICGDVHVVLASVAFGISSVTAFRERKFLKGKAEHWRRRVISTPSRPAQSEYALPLAT